jgi:hypothetical protein
MIDSLPIADRYNTDGWLGYIDVDYGDGRHIRNAVDKSDTHNVESVNCDLRHYIKPLQRRIRCFCRKIETLRAVIAIFVNAYNKFSEYKDKYRILVVHRPTTDLSHAHKHRETPLGLINFL